MKLSLSTEELSQLITRTFRPRPEDKRLALLIDFPASPERDNPDWRQRREMAADWAAKLAATEDRLGLRTSLFGYPQVAMNNGDLPATATRLQPGLPLPDSAAKLPQAQRTAFDEIFREHSLLIAPTEFSATAPLKLAAPRYGFRAATMPGFSPSTMIGALRLDYGEVNRRVELLQRLLTEAEQAQLLFSVSGKTEQRLTLDLRHRAAHASGGLLITPGTAGNLPSGEAYIVPYEGELSGDPSRSLGTLPVQFDDEVVLYEVRENRAVRVLSEGPASREEAARLAEEPAYGNLAELGLGVLDDFGVTPCGEILLDEKLGLHLAFGRSDHFGGVVGARQFSSPQRVVHIDRVYIPALQPRITVISVDLIQAGGQALPLMRSGRYVVEF